MAKESKHLMNEADIGSGERTLGQQEADRAIQSTNVPLAQVGAPQDGSQLRQAVDEQSTVRYQGQQDTALPGRILRSGDHIARIVAVKQPDEMFEAQVYVRLEREPQIAETFIPVGLHGTEAEAMAAAEERAERALREHEF